MTIKLTKILEEILYEWGVAQSTWGERPGLTGGGQKPQGGGGERFGIEQEPEKKDPFDFLSHSKKKNFSKGSPPWDSKENPWGGRGLNWKDEEPPNPTAHLLWLAFHSGMNQQKQISLGAINQLATKDAERYLGKPIKNDEISKALEDMKAKGWIKKIESFSPLKDNRGYPLAWELTPKAKQFYEKQAEEGFWTQIK